MPLNLPSKLLRMHDSALEFLLAWKCWRLGLGLIAMTTNHFVKLSGDGFSLRRHFHTPFRILWIPSNVCHACLKHYVILKTKVCAV